MIGTSIIGGQKSCRTFHWMGKHIFWRIDVESKILGRLNIGGTEVWLTQTVVTTWVIMAALIIIALILRAKMKNYKYKRRDYRM